MRKILFGVVITLVILFTFKYCGDKKEEKITLQEHTSLLQEQIKNVGKLVVTEGHFSEVFTYENSKAIFGDLLEAKKQAIVIVNADVTVGYDLSQMKYEIDENNQVLRIVNIPEEEIKISPDLEYYDIQADFFNQFEAEDYNEIKETVKASLMKKIEGSELKSNAQNRLISELSKFLILTNTLGWTLEYNQQPIEAPEQLFQLKL
ncbi:DUF4230 domain-containing protein [Psychroserpens sp.]|uniref:DUF4230 domain-containing protein n=1 Tax=Psychroserpens sp. TaxID=2020870 RepID=UPI001AFFB014|nr:DUF4230 domain-containing protein [Psychroserpens sp.]MBO6607964.1 DUF4230 domain-containing protein [Psychroserpens sp.]MBO6631112.1 DUF4230 domain-containing protein [Psychroserpens sp.]MBO6654909.1 DUF4230 domain-containing protein [Psychroserpens sp.]MBO6683017.1 DUF4230 domain-containing protein [Psychroserpens sp.]MBO6751322.1 DUF4230 domain-containing protein [Psychroserpens sp.]